jgi:drug/metabolite transporter (DMT)-like permease
MAETQAPAPAQNVLLGTVLIVTAFFSVAVMSAFGKAAAAVPTGMVVLFQNGISLLLLLPWVLQHGITDIKTRRLPLHLVRALSGLLSQALFFIAVKEMSLVDAVLLVNAAPLFIPLVVLVWFKTKITPMVWVSLVIGFVGVLLILRPSAALLSNPAALLATAAAAFSAIALVTVNRLSSTDKPDTILFYYFLISTIAALPFAIAGWRPPVGVEWGYLAGIGLFMAASQLFIILAYQHSTAQRLAPFNYSVVVFSGLIGWIIWQNVPDWIAVAGIVLVCVGGILSILFGGAQVKEHAAGHAVGQGHWCAPPVGRPTAVTAISGREPLQ